MPAPTVTVNAPAIESHPPVLNDVRALVRFVDKGWFSKDDGWAKLRELVGTAA